MGWTHPKDLIFINLCNFSQKEGGLAVIIIQEKRSLNPTRDGLWILQERCKGGEGWILPLAKIWDIGAKMNASFFFFILGFRWLFLRVNWSDLLILNIYIKVTYIKNGHFTGLPLNEIHFSIKSQKAALLSLNNLSNNIITDKLIKQNQIQTLKKSIQGWSPTELSLYIVLKSTTTTLPNLSIYSGTAITQIILMV